MAKPNHLVFIIKTETGYILGPTETVFFIKHFQSCDHFPPARPQNSNACEFGIKHNKSAVGGSQDSHSLTRIVCEIRIGVGLKNNIQGRAVFYTLDRPLLGGNPQVPRDKVYRG